MVYTLLSFFSLFHPSFHFLLPCSVSLDLRVIVCHCAADSCCPLFCLPILVFRKHHVRSCARSTPRAERVARRDASTARARRARGAPPMRARTTSTSWSPVRSCASAAVVSCRTATMCDAFRVARYASTPRRSGCAENFFFVVLLIRFLFGIVDEISF